VADVPGIIEGASEGTGLGLEFLKHLSRTSILLHIVDLFEPQEVPRVCESIKALVLELEKFDSGLYEKERWLVFNKTDLLEDPQSKITQIIENLAWEGPVFAISAVTSNGTADLSDQIMIRLNELYESEDSN